MGTDRVVVVGAGVSGLSIARELAADHDVVVLDAGGIAADTTSRASGMISLSLEPFDDDCESYAREAFRDLDGTGLFSFTERETVRLAPDGEPGNAPDGGRYLDREALLERYPDTFGELSAYAGGLVYDGTGYLDALDYAMTLKWLTESAGAGIYRDHTVEGVRVERGTVVGVDTEYGPIDADHVVYATGWRTRELLTDHVELPIRPLRWNAVVIEPTEPLAGAPLGSDPRSRTYWRPTPQGNVLIGGNEHLLSDPAETEMGVDPTFREAVRERVAPLLLGVAEGTLRREDCCPTADTASPDGLPIVDAPSEAPEGLVVATGLHGRGVMLSPVVGRAVRSLVTDEPSPFPLAPFELDRFADRSPSFDYRSHWG